jgi:hypothetical protein
VSTQMNRIAIAFLGLAANAIIAVAVVSISNTF